MSDYNENISLPTNYVLQLSMLSKEGNKYNNYNQNGYLLNKYNSKKKNFSDRNKNSQIEKKKSLRNKSTNLINNNSNLNTPSIKLKQIQIPFQNKTNKKENNNNYPGIYHQNKLYNLDYEKKKEITKKNYNEKKRFSNNSTITTISKKNNLIDKTSNNILKNVDNIFKSALYIENEIKSQKIHLPEINNYKRPPSNLNKKNNNLIQKKTILESNKLDYNEDDKRYYNKDEVKYKLKYTNPNLMNSIYTNHNNIKPTNDYIYEKSSNLSNKNNNQKNEIYNYNNATNLISNQILETKKTKINLENNSNLNSDNQFVKSEKISNINSNINLNKIYPSNTNSENNNPNKINSDNINSNEINSNEINSNETNSDNINSNNINSNEMNSDNINSNNINSNKINSDIINLNSTNNINKEINTFEETEEKNSSLILRSQTPPSINTTTLNIISSLIGLNNLGNTCFMNTCLQNLIHCKPLIKELLKIKNEVFTKKISSSFLNLCLNISKTQKSFSPNDFRNTFCYKHYQYANYGQHDTVELLRTLLDDISKELNTIKIIPKYYELKTENKSKEIQNNEYHNWYLTRENSIIISIFYAQIINTFTCECGYKSFSFEKILDIPLLLPNNKYSDNLNLINLLNNYLSGEKFKWDSKCEKCKEKNLYHQKSIQFAKLPKILVFSIQRYNYLSYGKSNKSVSFNDEIDLSNFIDKDLVKQKNTKYKLFGVSNHSGTLDFGHYYSYTKVNNKWYEFNDSSVYQRSISYNSSNVYALFYELID